MVSHPPVHGGNVHAAARELRRPIGSILDFSASINPLGPSPKAVRALVDAAHLVQHYPDPDCDQSQASDRTSMAHLARAYRRRKRLDRTDRCHSSRPVHPLRRDRRANVCRICPCRWSCRRPNQHGDGERKRRSTVLRSSRSCIDCRDSDEPGRRSMRSLFVIPIVRPAGPAVLKIFMRSSAPRSGRSVGRPRRVVHRVLRSIDLYAAVAFSYTPHHPAELYQILWAARV